jgi:hypothetical protein
VLPETLTEMQAIAREQSGTTSTFSARASGDGFELLDPGGNIIAWTLDGKWALRILLALELLFENNFCGPHETGMATWSAPKGRHL